jgi:hypothetical protein
MRQIIPFKSRNILNYMTNWLYWMNSRVVAWMVQNIGLFIADKVSATNTRIFSWLPVRAIFARIMWQ